MCIISSRMHERYGYIYEILALLLAIYDKKTIIGLLPMYLCSIITYSHFYSKQNIVLEG